jgi:hypothetical protein
MTMHWIAGQTATAGTGAFSLLNIPQTFDHLQIRMTARSTYTGSENMFMRINNTASINWSGHYVGGSGSGSGYTGNYSTSNYADLTAIANGSQSTNVFGSYIIDILDYSNPNKNKTIRCMGGFDNNGSGFVELRSALAVTNSVITDISQIGGTAVGTFGLVAGSRVDLYGFTSNPTARGV